MLHAVELVVVIVRDVLVLRSASLVRAQVVSAALLALLFECAVEVEVSFIFFDRGWVVIIIILHAPVVSSGWQAAIYL